jgi:hypothetical protein
LGLGGVTSPTATLDVGGTSGSLARFGTNSGNGSLNFYPVTINDGNSAGGGTNQTFLRLGRNSNGAAAIDAFEGGVGGSALAFGTFGTERARIDSSGNLLVGTTSTLGNNGNTLQVFSSQTAQIVVRNNAQAAGRFYRMGVEGSNDVFIIYPDGTGGVFLTRGATSWTGNSDERLKTDLSPIENAAAKVSSLRAVTGRFTADEENVSRAFLIAQDVQAVLPQAVDVRDDEQGTLGLRYTDTIPLLVAAIKELKAELDATKAEVALLKGAA